MASALVPALLRACQAYIKQRTPSFLFGAAPLTQEDGSYQLEILPPGETVSPGTRLDVLKSYTSTTLGGQGGPQTTDNLVVLRSPGKRPIIIGHVARKGEPPNDFCPLVLVCDPPTGVPTGNLGIGHSASKSPLDGYAYDGLNGAAHIIILLHEDHMADVEAVYSQRSDGSFYAFGSVSNEYVDKDNPPLGETEGPSIHAFRSGVIHAWGGVVTAVVTGHEPTDADIAKDPYLLKNYADGTTIIRQDEDHKAAYYRAFNEMNRLANLALFAGTDASGEEANHAEGDLGYGTDGSLWLCTAAGTPGTWVRQYPPTAVCAQLYTSGTNLSGSETSPYEVAWSSVEKNDGMTVDLGSDPTKITAASAGTYFFQAEINVVLIMPGQAGIEFINLFIRKNGVNLTTPNSEWYYDTDGAADTFDLNPRESVSISTLVDLDAGDYVELQITWSGGATTVSLDGCHFIAYRIG